MTTSLATLASNPLAHTSSTVIMSTQPAMNYNYSNQQQQNYQNQHQQQQQTLMESGEYDSSQETKTEFYTREGLWKLIKHGEFVKQQQNNNNNNNNNGYQISNQYNNNSNGMSHNGQMSNQAASSNSNEPVKLAFFNYSNDIITNSGSGSNSSSSSSSKFKLKNYCIKCMKIIISKQQKRIEKSNINNNYNSRSTSDHDDDDDIVYFNNNSNNNDNDDKNNDTVCKYCNAKLNPNDDSLSLSNTSINNNNNNNNLDVIIFNYAREIYFYEFNPFKTKSSSDMKNLIDKKVYRSFISTCFDVNLLASNLNTLDLQNKSVLNNNTNTNTKADLNLQNNNETSTTTATSSSMSTSSGASMSGTTTTSTKMNLSPSCLSLIIAAGFSKGEIHVFDGFKKDASVFYNNNKLVEKSKVTCIKWLPNSMNLFLAGYSSGNIYLYDANNQTQPNTSPVFTKLYQDESFSLHINNHSNTYSTSASNHQQHSSSSSTTPNSTPIRAKSAASTTTSSNGHSNDYTSSTTSFNNSDNYYSAKNKQDKLILLNTNQQPVQIAKNPLLKWTIGASNPSTDPSSSSSSSSSEQVFFNTSSNCVGVNGVNEFSFSPCGAYLAVVSQDGYMRVFSFAYQNNQQMQISLRCSMKSYFGGLLCVTWSPDGRFIATGGEDDLITIFSFVDMRVACRGRGHSSWINACSFDPWTCLNNGNNLTNFNKSTKATTSTNNENDDESDLEDYHGGLKKLNLDNNDKKITVPKKNRTISTLSDLNNHQMQTNSVQDSIYYRLASCGQDNQICFWDLTEECLKEKAIPSHSRSRLTSLAQNPTKTVTSTLNYQLPQIIIQPSDFLVENSNNKILANQPTVISNLKETNHHHHHHSTTSSIVSTARSLFSLKHNGDSNNSSKSSKTNKNEINELNPTDLLISTNPSSSNNNTNVKSNMSLTGNFFKKHKRNASLTNTGITNGMSEITTPTTITTNNKTNKSSKNNNNTNQIILNSYKKSSNTINLTENISQLNDNNMISNSSDNNNTKKQMNNYYDSSTTSIKTASISNNSSFNLCPKLDEIPIIEPLICKRIASERLNSILFKEDSFVVSTQDGYVFTWARPVSNQSQSTNNKSNPLLQLNSEFKTNTTSL